MMFVAMELPLIASRSAVTGDEEDDPDVEAVSSLRMVVLLLLRLSLEERQCSWLLLLLLLLASAVFEVANVAVFVRLLCSWSEQAEVEAGLLLAVVLAVVVAPGKLLLWWLLLSSLASFGGRLDWVAAVVIVYDVVVAIALESNDESKIELGK